MIPHSILGRGVYRVATGLYQGALLYVCHVEAEIIRREVDVIWLLAPEIETIPTPEIILRTPIDDCAEGSAELSVLAMQAEEIKNRRVLTVCHMGENRSGLGSALILMARGLSAHQAVGHVWANVPPSSMDHDHALWNPGFTRQLLGA